MCVRVQTSLIERDYLIVEVLITDVQMWAKHFFVLTDEKLFFTEQQDREEEPEKEDEPEVGVVM